MGDIYIYLGKETDKKKEKPIIHNRMIRIQIDGWIRIRNIVKEGHKRHKPREFRDRIFIL